MMVSLDHRLSVGGSKMSQDKLKLIVVDDESLIRDLLTNSIDWEEINIDVVGEASDSDEALELVDRIVPDIIITDICLPYIDGIEFSRIVVEKYPHIKIIILTGFQDFEYAKRSIKVGVSEFLTKPINSNEILKVVLNIKERIVNEKTKQNEVLKLKKLLDESLPYAKESFLNELIHKKMPHEDIIKKFEYFGIEVIPDSFQIAVILVDSNDKVYLTDEKERHLLRIKGIECIKQFFRSDKYVNVFFDNSQRIIVLNNKDDINLVDCCDSIKSMMINRMECYVSIGIGNKYEGIYGINQSYKEAHEALNYSTILGKNQISCYSDISGGANENAHIQGEQADSLRLFLKSGLKEKALAHIDDILNDEAIKKMNMSKDLLRVRAADIISIILDISNELNLKHEEIFIESLHPYEEVFKITELPEMTEYIKSLVSKTALLTSGIQTKKVSKVVENIQKYLADNISDYELSLSIIAKAFYLNPSYLSRIFKMETGVSFVEYLTKHRVDKALQLLKETDLKFYEIAEKVGLLDPHYLGVCFKKYTGMSMSDYRKTVCGKEE